MLKPAPKAGSQADEINLQRVEDHLLGGGVLTHPLTLGVTTGTGRLIKAEGTKAASHDPASDFFAYGFKLI